LKVSDLHTIYYEVYGNPNGKPVIYVHGGPGGGLSPRVSISSIIIDNNSLYLSYIQMARFFDPKYYRIILVDQRGCGKSTPFAELKENTTYDLVEDFEKIRKKLGIDKWQVFGGSWGSTLSLAYAVSIHNEFIYLLYI
jgi:proline iminopeptidase